MGDKIIVARTWDQLQTVVESGGERFSLRLLRREYKEMAAEIERLKSDLDSLNRKASHGCFDFNCPDCDGR